MAARGRPSQPVDAEVARRWSERLNGSQCPASGWSTTRYAVFELDCRHVARLQMASVQRSVRARKKSGLLSATCFRCRYCQGTGSELWRDAVSKIEGSVRGVGAIAFECHMVEGARKAFDIYLVERQVAVEADGPHHFGIGWGLQPWQQYDWDREIDKACEAQQLRLVRLHHNDMLYWASQLQDALESPDSPTYVTYTPSYTGEAQRRAAAATTLVEWGKGQGLT